MKNFKKLSREELKNTFGGLRGCTHVIQGADGTWVTRRGYCKDVVTASMGDSAADLIGQHLTSQQYCDTGLGQVNVTSNGGVSRCN